MFFFLVFLFTNKTIFSKITFFLRKKYFFSDFGTQLSFFFPQFKIFWVLFGFKKNYTWTFSDFLRLLDFLDFFVFFWGFFGFVSKLRRLLLKFIDVTPQIT